MKTSTQSSLLRSLTVTSFLVLAGTLFVAPALRGTDNDTTPPKSNCPTPEDCDKRCGGKDAPPGDEEGGKWARCQNDCLLEIIFCRAEEDEESPARGGQVVLPDVQVDAVAVVVESEGETSSGDTNGDGLVDLSDAVRLLQYLFVGGEAPATILIHGFADVAANFQRSPDGKRLLIGGNLVLRSGDVDGNGVLDMSDAIRILQHLFSDGTAPVKIVAQPPVVRPPHVDPRIPPIVIRG